MRRNVLSLAVVGLGIAALAAVLVVAPACRSEAGDEEGSSRAEAAHGPAAPGAAGGDGEAPQPAARVVGLSVARPDGGEHHGGHTEFGVRPGTSVYVRVRQPGGHIIDIDEDACVLQAFTDDLGTVLAQPGKPSFRHSWLGAFPHIADDHQSCIPTLRADKVPAAKARQVHVQAKLVLVAGAEPKTAKVRTALKTGTKVGLGSVAATVHKVEPGRGGDTKLRVTFRSGRSFEPIREVTFRGPDGEEIESRSLGATTMTFNGQATHDRTWGLAKKVDQVTMEVRYFERIERVTVPRDLQVSVGL